MATFKILLVICMLTLTACDGDDASGGGAGGADATAAGGAGGEPTSDAGNDAGDGGLCESFPTEHTQLLNAPTEAAVVRKTPTHPPVGPEGLP